MTEIFSKTRGDYKLIHSRYIDPFGFPKDSFELIKHEDDGSLSHIPFHGDLKVKTMDWNGSISLVTDYVEEEYDLMLDKQIKNFENRNPKNT